MRIENSLPTRDRNVSITYSSHRNIERFRPPGSKNKKTLEREVLIGTYGLITVMKKLGKT